MEYSYDTTSTDLFLIRIWKQRSDDGAFSLHGRLQHVVSGASCYFDGLSGLPRALEQMVEDAELPFGPNAESLASDEPDDDAHTP